MKISIFFLTLLCSFTLKAQTNDLSIFNNLVGKIWYAEGKWGDGSSFKQQVHFEFDLEQAIVTAKSKGFTNQEQTTYGNRNLGVRKIDTETGEIRFWEFDVFGGLTQGKITAVGKNLLYQYQYGESFITDMWEYMNDSTYNFKVPEVNNPAVTGNGSFLSTFYYYKDNIGFALVNEELDPRIFQLIIDRGGIQNLTPEDIDQVFFWLFTSPTGAWVQVDLAAQTSTKINGLPPLSPFDASNMSFIDGIPHFAIANPSVNAYFRLNEGTGAVEKVFDMEGANIVSVIDLSINE